MPRTPTLRDIPGLLHAFDPETTALDGAAMGAVTFDGEDQRLTHPAPIAPSYPFSVAIWFRTTDSDSMLWGQYSAAGGNHGNYLLVFEDEVWILSDQRSGGYHSGSKTLPYTPGEWHLAVAVWESDSSRKLSIDGSPFVSDATPVPLQEAPTQTTLGAYGAGSYTNHYAGALGPCGVWGRALSESEAAQLYNGGDGLAYAALGGGLLGGLLSWHAFAERSGTRADARGDFDLAPEGDPGAAPGPGPVVASGHAWEGMPVAAVGDFMAAGNDALPTARMYPRRLELGPTAPGMRRVGATIGGRPSWTHAARLDDVTTALASGFAYETHTAADGSYLDLGIGPGLVPFVAAAGAGGSGEATATCPVPAFGRFGVLSGTTEDVPALVTGQAQNDWPQRTRCVLRLDGLGDMAKGNRVTVAACGSPFDGTHVLDACKVDTATGEFEVAYVVDEPFAGAATATPGTVTPTGEVRADYPDNLGTGNPSWPVNDPMPCCLRVERTAGNQLNWYVNGILLGSADASALPLGGDGTGNATVVIGRPDDGRRAGPAILPSYLAAYSRVLTASEALDVDVRLACRLAGGFDYAEHPCFVDCESLPGLGRRRGAHGDILITWIDDATGDVAYGDTVDSRTGDRRGVARSDFCSEHLGTSTQTATTTYTLVIAYKSPRFDDQGNAQASEWLYAGTVARATRLPYEPSRTIHVDPGAPGADDNNDGSGGSPKATLQGGVNAAGAGVLILLARGQDYDKATLPAGRGPYCVAAEPGAGARPHVSQGAQPAANWAEECLKVAAGVAHAVVVGLHLDQDAGVTSGTTGNGGGVAIYNDAISWGFAARDLYCTAPTGGYALKPDGVQYWSLADCEMPGDAAVAYPILWNGGRRFVLRRCRVDRPCDPTGSHVIRAFGCDVYYIGGCSADPAIPNVHPTADVTLRGGGRRVTVDACDWGNIPLQIGGPDNGHPGTAGPGRVRWAGCVAKSLMLEGCSDYYIGGCYTISGGLYVNVNTGDLGRPGGEKLIAEGNAWVGSGVSSNGTELIGYPAGAADPWRNTNPATAATGEPLQAPALDVIAIAGAPWLYAIAPGGVAQGGTLPRGLGLEADGVDMGGGSAWPMTVASLSAGSHTLAALATDAVPATDTGDAITLTVAGTRYVLVARLLPLRDPATGRIFAVRVPGVATA